MDKVKPGSMCGVCCVVYGVWTEGGHRYPSGSAVLRKARDVRCERVGEPVLRGRRGRIGVAEWTLRLRPEA